MNICVEGMVFPHATPIETKQRSIVCYNLVDIRDPTLYTNISKVDMIGQ